MEKWWFNSMFSNEELEHRCGLSKSMDSLGPIGYTSGNEDPVINDTDKNVPSWSDSGSCSFSNVEHLFDIRDIWSFISDHRSRQGKGALYPSCILSFSFRVPIYIIRE